jgi:hypothetical protein
MLAVALVGCGDPTEGFYGIPMLPEPPPDPARAALTFDVRPAAGAQCPGARALEVPRGAARLFEGVPDELALNDDGEHRVSCSVLVLPEPPEAYRVTLELRAAELGVFRAEGTLSQYEPSLLKVQLSDGVQQVDCSTTPQVIRAQGLWLNFVECPHLTDANDPGVACSAQLALLFDNCK